MHVMRLHHDENWIGTNYCAVVSDATWYGRTRGRRLSCVTVAIGSHWRLLLSETNKVSTVQGLNMAYLGEHSGGTALVQYGSPVMLHWVASDVFLAMCSRKNWWGMRKRWPSECMA